MAGSRTKSIQELVDRFRKSDDVLTETTVISNGVRFLLEKSGKGDEFLNSVLKLSDDFPSGNDPNAERDFGRFELLSVDAIWQIDRIDTTRGGGPEEPIDPKSSCWAMTIMLAYEY